jgi:hypothetical protein
MTIGAFLSCIRRFAIKAAAAGALMVRHFLVFEE